MSCHQCKFVDFDIKHPNDLKKAIRSAKDAVECKKIEYLGIGEYGDSFRWLAMHLSWGDFVHNYFRCSACNQLIKLWAETYHGSGGGFRHVANIEGQLTADKL